MARPVSRRAAVAAALAAVGVVGVAACAVPESSAGTGEVSGKSGKPTPAEVERAQQQLDERASRVPSSVTSWGIDPAIGLVVVRVTGGRTPEVDRFLDGIDPRTLRVVTGSDPVRPLPGTG